MNQIRSISDDEHIMNLIYSSDYEEAIDKLRQQGHDPLDTESIRESATRLRDIRNDCREIDTRIGKFGGEAYLHAQGYHIPDEFLSENISTSSILTPDGWADGMAISANGDEIVIPKYQGVDTELDRTPHPTTYEGNAPQGTPAYTRDHMLSDPRFAQYFHDHSDIWDKVKRGQIRLTIMVIKTVSPDLTQVAAEPFALTTKTIQHLQQNIDTL